MSGLWIGLAISAVSLGVSLDGQAKAKKAGKADAEFQAGQLRESAMTSRASGQRQAEEERRQAALVDSALQARAGGGGLDPTVVKLSRDIAGEGEYRALAALYEGETNAIGRERSADAAIRTGRAQATAANYQMAGTVLSTAGSMWGKYDGSKKAGVN